MKPAQERMATPLPMPFSKAVRANGFLFLSGVLPMDGNGQLVPGDIGMQTRNVIERIAATLNECGAGLGDVVRATVWLADLADFAGFNAEYKRHFGGHLPARSTVQAVLYGGASIEIEVQRSMRKESLGLRNRPDIAGGLLRSGAPEF